MRNRYWPETFIVSFTLVIAVIFVIHNCAPGDTDDIRLTEQDTTTTRDAPIVYWWDGPAAIDTTEDIAYWFRQRDEPHGVYEIDGDSTKMILDVLPTPINLDVTLRLSEGQQVEWWRVEWSPVPDSCFYYLGAYAIPPGADRYHLPHSGIINVKIFGLEAGDRLMFWRSHPWPDSLPNECFETGGGP
jgi:hypothetical protein